MSSLGSLKSKAGNTSWNSDYLKVWDKLSEILAWSGVNDYCKYGSLCLGRKCGVQSEFASNITLGCVYISQRKSLLDYLPASIVDEGYKCIIDEKDDCSSIIIDGVGVSISIKVVSEYMYNYIESSTKILPTGICILDMFDSIIRRGVSSTNEIKFLCDCIGSNHILIDSAKRYLNSLTFECEKNYSYLWNIIADAGMIIKDRKVTLEAITVLSFLSSVLYQGGVCK